MEPIHVACIRVPECVLFRELDGEAVLLNLDNETYYRLNVVATDCWNYLAGGNSVGATGEQVAAAHGINREQADHDAMALVEDLLAEGLIEIDHGLEAA